jgi:glucosamine--fructose-6-phosphate aminotransferase (isomerizing)
VIENFKELKGELDSELKSDTDTEIIAHMLENEFKITGYTIDAITEVMKKLRGSYALAIINKEEPELIYVVKNKSPLLIGKADGFGIIGSDAMAMIEYTNEFYELEDGDYAIISKNNVEIFNAEKSVTRKTFTASINVEDIDKGIYPHYMLKEINEQSSVIRKIIDKYEVENGINKDVISLIKKADRIHIIAAGTSYHAGLIGKNYFENISNIPTEVHIASEFAYNTPLIGKNPLFIFISQSGETADLRTCLVKLKANNFKTITITNVDNSTLARDADFSLLLHAGPEIAVASTKAYIAQLSVLAVLANKLSDSNIDMQLELSKVAVAIDEVVFEKEKIKEVTERLTTGVRNCFYIGRSTDSLVALEAALKLKEISYIQTEGFAAGELKHGTIALIEEGVPVFGIITRENVALNTRSNLEEVRSRGANIAVISMERLSDSTDDIIINDVHELLAPIAAVVPTQLISYYAALQRGLNIDKPRNLAKSVTVE